MTTTTPPVTTTTPPSGSCSALAYNSATAYTGGQQVSYNGHTWTAKWWTQGEAPSNAGTGVWQDNGACSAAATTPPGGSCSGLSAYSSTAVYTAGQSASYGGHKWTAKWWTQGEAPSAGGSGVWADNGAC